MRRSVVKTYSRITRRLSRAGLNRFSLLRSANKLVVSRLKTTSAEVRGRRMYLDPGDSLNLSIHGVYEPVETELVARLVSPGDFAIDVGANIGYYTLILAGLVGESGRVIAFEPDPQNFGLLSRNVELGGGTAVTAVNKAVWSRSGALRPYLSESDVGAHTVADWGDGSKSIEIEAVSLDDFFKGHAGDIDFMKVDVEGAEAAVIQGMQAVLDRNPGLRVLTELNVLALERAGWKPEDYLGLLLNHGFELHYVNEAAGNVERTDIATLLTSHDFGKAPAYVLCARPEHVPPLENLRGLDVTRSREGAGHNG